MTRLENNWQCGRFSLQLNQPKIMGVLNCTPDSFSDGGKFNTIDKALQRAEQMIAEKVDIIDIGAESTRPGSKAISAQEEIERLKPIVQALVQDGRKPISIDTKKTAVMQAMLELGADIINDVNGFEDKDAIHVIAQYSCGVCIMHMRGMPESMQKDTNYQDVLKEIGVYLQNRAQVLIASGINSKRIILDPGFGFGKTPEQNMLLIRELKKITQSYPALIGVSRKSTIGHYLNQAPVEERLIGSVVLAALGAWQGANIIRAHDIKATKEALMMVEALKNA